MWLIKDAGAVRAHIISLSIWVSKYTSQMIREQGNYDLLIEVNRIIMQGLGARVAAA